MVWADDLALAVSSDATYRQYALVYCLLVGVGGDVLQRRGLKAHFFGTYLNVVANVLFWALLSGVFERESYGLWFLALTDRVWRGSDLGPEATAVCFRCLRMHHSSGQKVVDGSIGTSYIIMTLLVGLAGLFGILL